MKWYLIVLFAIVATVGLTTVFAEDTAQKEPFSCPKDDTHVEMYGFKPETTLDLPPGKKALPSSARYRKTSQGIAIAACIPFRPFAKGEHAEHYKIIMKPSIASDEFVVFYIQEHNLTPTPRK